MTADNETTRHCCHLECATPAAFEVWEEGDELYCYTDACAGHLAAMLAWTSLVLPIDPQVP